MSIKGNLETFYLTTLLQMLCHETKTGVLRLKHKENNVSIYIQNGDIIYATDSRRQNRLGDLLMEKSLITAQQLEECITISQKKGYGLGKVLLVKGYVSRKALYAVVLKQALKIIYNVFLWEQGEFEYQDMEHDLDGMVICKIDTMALLLEAARRIDEMAVLKKVLKSETMVLKISGKVQREGAIKLRPSEQKILSLINGSMTLREIIDKSGFDDLTGYKIVNALVSSGKVEIDEEARPGSCIPKLLARIESVDLKSFRTALDDLGLKRSSSLRLALTRIFRSATDEKELMEAVSEEAKKIIRPEDREELQRIKGVQKDSYLGELISLLWENTV